VIGRPAATSRRSASTANLSPLRPQRKWRAITLASLLLAPAVWSLLIGLVAAASDDENRPAAGPAIALGLCLIPFVYMVLAFASEHPQAPGAVVRAMGMCLLAGIMASALAADAITGVVAGIGAGGIFALRSDAAHSIRLRAGAVIIASVYVFVLVRIAGPVALIAAPVFPFTALGLADHYAEWRLARNGAPDGSGGRGPRRPIHR
jgi:hypothetical protein